MSSLRLENFKLSGYNYKHTTSPDEVDMTMAPSVMIARFPCHCVVLIQCLHLYSWFFLSLEQGVRKKILGVEAHDRQACDI